MIEIIARSSGMLEAVRLAERVAVTDTNVLVTGESGVGKDVLAFFIHSKSPRSSQPFVKIDCDAKPGRFDAAHKGTLVLDEIAHLSNDAQAKLLRVIESREFERLGGHQTIKVDARLIALTNVDLSDAVQRRGFREDLFYRLNVIHIQVPPLRERKEDLSQLIQAFLEQYSTKHGRNIEAISAEALAVLQVYDFPGNTRELANIVERAVIVASGKRLGEQDLPASVRAAVNAQERREKPLTLSQVEAAYIAEMLAATGGNKTECARILGISRKNLYEKIARYNL